METPVCYLHQGSTLVKLKLNEAGTPSSQFTIQICVICFSKQIPPPFTATLANLDLFYYLLFWILTKKDQPPWKLLDRVRDVSCRKHYSIRTEGAYVN